MSGSQPKFSGAKLSGTQSGAGADPSMEDILASIRRILSEEDLPPDPPAAQASEASLQADDQPDVLILDSSMLVEEVSSRREPDRLAPRPPVVARSPLPPEPPMMVPPAIAEDASFGGTSSEEAQSSQVTALDSASAAGDEPLAMPPPEAAKTEPELHSEPDHAQPAKFQTETSMRAEAVPALTPSSLDKMVPPVSTDAMVSADAVTEAVATAPSETNSENVGEVWKSPVGRMPAAPILVPVPLSGQIPPPPLIKRPEALAKESVFTTRPPPPSTDPLTSAETRPAAPETALPETESSPMSASMSLSSGLASPETTSAAAGSVTNLVRALTSDRSAQVHSGGPTIADLVREELRPLVKSWLDSNLPPLVERLVRAEIERVISRAAV
jgi:uncharacterized protein